MKQVIVSNLGKVWELVVVDIHRKAFLYLLLDVVVDDSIRLARTGCAEHHRGTERINDIDPALVPLLLIVEACRKVYRVFVLHQPCFLHEALILRIEHIVHQVVLQQSAHPHTTHQQEDIANGEREDIERSRSNFSYGQCQQPPVEKEQDEAEEKHRPNLWPCDFLLFHAFCPKAGQDKKNHTKEFCPENG